MGELFFTSPKGFKFEIIKYTTDKQKNETNNPSTDEEVLLALEKIDKTGFCTELLNHRGLTTLYGTFIKGMYERLTPNNKVHGRFLLHGTVTGRLCIGQDCLLNTNKGLVRIGDIIPDKYDSVQTIDNLEVLTHTGEYKPITHVINKGLEMMYEVELENGNKIQCTENHRFLTNKGWLKLNEITDESIISWEADNNKNN